MSDEELEEDLREIRRIVRDYHAEAGDQEMHKLAKRIFEAAAAGRDIREWAIRWLETDRWIWDPASPRWNDTEENP